MLSWWLWLIIVFCVIVALFLLVTIFIDTIMHWLYRKSYKTQGRNDA